MLTCERADECEAASQTRRAMCIILKSASSSKTVLVSSAFSRTHRVTAPRSDSQCSAIRSPLFAQIFQCSPARVAQVPCRLRKGALSTRVATLLSPPRQSKRSAALWWRRRTRRMPREQCHRVSMMQAIEYEMNGTPK